MEIFGVVEIRGAPVCARVGRGGVRVRLPGRSLSRLPVIWWLIVLPVLASMTSMYQPRDSSPRMVTCWLSGVRFKALW